MDKLVGEKFNSFTIIDIREELGCKLYCLRCDCGKMIPLYENQLNKQNCGKCNQSKVYRPIRGRPEMDTPEYKQWRKAIMAKYQWKCFCCGTKKNLCAHHLASWAFNPHLRYDVKNGVCLCNTRTGNVNEFGKEGCHNLFHKIFSKKNNTKEEFIIFARKYYGKEFK